ncbi:MAG: RND transporter [Nocardioides sp.]|nr:RND transporter [Nocardioides sp.]
MTRRNATSSGATTARWPRVVAALVLLALAAATAGGLRQLEFNTSVATFLDENDPVRVDYQANEQVFGSDPVTVVIRRTDDAPLLTTDLLPRLIGLEGELAQLPNVAVVYGPGTALNQLAASAQNILSDISFKRQAVAVEAEQQARAAGRTDQQVAQAKKAAVERFDLRYGVLLTKALPAGLPTLSNQGFIDAVAFEDGQTRPNLRFVAPDDHTVAIVVRPEPEVQQEDIAELVSSVRSTVATDDLGPVDVKVSGSPVVLAALVGQTREEIPLLTIASVIVVGILLGIGVLRERRRRRWLGVLVPLVAAGGAVLVDLAILGWLGSPASLVLVAVLPALIGIGSDVPIYLGSFGPSRRVLAVAAASAAGFAMTALSSIPFLRQLGGLLAIGVLVACAIGYLLRVVLQADFPRRPGASTVEVASAAGASDQPSPASSARRRVTTARLGLVVVTALAALGWAVLPTIALNADLAGLADGLPVEQEAQESEEALGASGELDVLLVGSGTSAEALAWSRDARAAVIAAHGDEVRPILSPTQLLGFLGDNPTNTQVSAALAIVPAYLLGAALSDDGSTASLSFGVVPSSIGAQRALIDSIRDQLPPPPEGSRVVVTGVPAVAAREFVLLDESRLWSNVLGVLAPASVLLLALGWRRRTEAGQALLSAAIATGLGLLALRLSGASLTPLTCALGSLTAAVGCEFTVMLRNHVSAWRSVLVAGSTSIAGYLVLLGSQLDIMRNFALVLALSVVWAGLASVIVALAFPGRVTTRDDSRSPIPVDADRGLAERVP